MSIKEYLFEFNWVGAYVKVSAIDPVTNIEVSIVGASNTNEVELKRIAINKLEYVIEKNKKRNSKK
ncbi:MAG: hypothetical protein CMM49_01595 [Rhodospirillaceae bacterium]|nr:hypothetical protein [Rhodospirillaceae bacterium]|tara:strand:+ start:559 stop:756 length:198 start_codon:yes stop_codon:yes gene_type:complete